MGPRAAVAVPELIELLDSDVQTADFAIMILASIGPKAAPAVPKLLELADDNEMLASSVILALGAIGPAASEALPTLHKWMMNDECWNAGMAAEAVTKIDASADVSDRIRELLDNPLEGNRISAAQLLPNFVEPELARQLLAKRLEIEQDKDTRWIINGTLNSIMGPQKEFDGADNAQDVPE
jgi:hypothetical protein